jgi:hypothetical protein
MTKAEAIQEAVDLIQEAADLTGDPALWHMLGRLEVVGTFIHVFDWSLVEEYLTEAREALADFRRRIA